MAPHTRWQNTTTEAAPAVPSEDTSARSAGSKKDKKKKMHKSDLPQLTIRGPQGPATTGPRPSLLLCILDMMRTHAYSSCPGKVCLVSWSECWTGSPSIYKETSKTLRSVIVIITNGATYDQKPYIQLKPILPLLRWQTRRTHPEIVVFHQVATLRENWGEVCVVFGSINMDCAACHVLLSLSLSLLSPIHISRNPPRCRC